MNISIFNFQFSMMKRLAVGAALFTIHFSLLLLSQPFPAMRSWRRR